MFGEYRAPTGVTAASAAGADAERVAEVRKRVERAAKSLGVGRIRILVGKPGLDGHSNAAEQIAVRARGVDPERVPVVVGGTIPDEDAKKLRELGVARVFMPKDYDLTRNLGEVVELLSGNGKG